MELRVLAPPSTPFDVEGIPFPRFGSSFTAFVLILGAFLASMTPRFLNPLSFIAGLVSLFLAPAAELDPPAAVLVSNCMNSSQPPRSCRFSSSSISSSICRFRSPKSRCGSGTSSSESKSNPFLSGDSFCTCLAPTRRASAAAARSSAALELDFRFYADGSAYHAHVFDFALY